MHTHRIRIERTSATRSGFLDMHYDIICLAGSSIRRQRIVADNLPGRVAGLYSLLGGIVKVLPIALIISLPIGEFLYRVVIFAAR